MQILTLNVIVSAGVHTHIHHYSIHKQAWMTHIPDYPAFLKSPLGHASGLVFHLEFVDHSVLLSFS